MEQFNNLPIVRQVQIEMASIAEDLGSGSDFVRSTKIEPDGISYFLHSGAYLYVPEKDKVQDNG